MPFIKTALARVPKTTWGLFIVFWKFRFWFILLLILTPTIIDSVNVAIETDNPIYPFAQLGLRIFSADNDIQKVVNMLREDPVSVIGVSKPSEGIWAEVVYYWKFSINIVWRLLGDLYLVFLPLYVFYRLLHLSSNISLPARNFTRATFLFILYLFITNTVVLVHGVVKGNTIILIPEGLDNFKEYWLIFLYLLPLHGIGNLILYLLQTARTSSMALVYLFKH